MGPISGSEPIEVSTGARAVRIELFLQLVPKQARGELQLVSKANEGTLRELLTRYDLSVHALPHVEVPVDRFEGSVDIDPKQAAERIMFAPERQLLFSEPKTVTTPDTHTAPPLTNRRQQAAAILIATIALLTSLLQLLR